jgi:hypothetical protein
MVCRRARCRAATWAARTASSEARTSSESPGLNDSILDLVRTASSIMRRFSHYRCPAAKNGTTSVRRETRPGHQGL